MNAELLGGFLIGAVVPAAIFVALVVGLRLGIREKQRNATPREPNPEPGPRVTPRRLKTGGRKGLREERDAILRKHKEEHYELIALDPADESFAAEYDHRLKMKDNYRRQLLAVEVMLKEPMV